MDAITLIALLGAMGGLAGIGALLQARTLARKTDVDSLCSALGELRKENDRLVGRMTELEAENGRQRELIADLRAQIAGYEAEIARLQRELNEMGVRRKRMPLMS